MSSAYKNNNTWSASDIEKYLKGELPAREMHQLEQAALEDPFLADAIEGMALHPAPGPDSPAPAATLDQDLAELRTRLVARTMAKNHRPAAILPFRLKIAAAIILLLGLGITTYYILLPGAHSRMSIAKKESPAPAAPTISASVAGKPAAATSEPRAAATPASAQPTALADSTIYIARSTPKHKTAKPAAPPPAAESLTKKMVTDPLEFKTVSADREKFLASAPSRSAGFGSPPTLKDSIRAMAQLQSVVIRGLGNRQAANQLVFNGKVLDEHNNPLPGASLILNGGSGDNKYNGYTNIGTVTDRQGQFSIRLRPQDSTSSLTVALVGYEQASLALNTLNTDNAQNNIIRLQQQHSSLDEVLVVGYGTQRKETLATAPSANDERLDSLWQRATPVIGRKAYLQWLADTQKSLSLDSTIRGTETISFEIDRSGALTAFKIEQSLSPAHDAGVIRLVKEGPAWQLLHGRKARAVVSVTF